MVKTRSRVKTEEQWQRDYLFARPSDDEVRDLKKNFDAAKPAPKMRQPRRRVHMVRRPVSPEMVRRIYEMHFNLQYSFKKIGQLLHCPQSTACTALKRMRLRDGELDDRRRFNGRRNGRLKIVPRISRHLLDPKVLQDWGFLGL